MAVKCAYDMKCQSIVQARLLIFDSNNNVGPVLHGIIFVFIFPYPPTLPTF